MSKSKKLKSQVSAAKQPATRANESSKSVPAQSFSTITQAPVKPKTKVKCPAKSSPKRSVSLEIQARDFKASAGPSLSSTPGKGVSAAGKPTSSSGKGNISPDKSSEKDPKALQTPKITQRMYSGAAENIPDHTEQSAGKQMESFQAALTNPIPLDVRWAQDVALLNRITQVPGRQSHGAIPRPVTRVVEQSDIRTFSLKEEKELTTTLAFLSSVSENKDQVTAVCLEETPGGCKVLLAVNRLDADTGQDKLAKIRKGFERIFQDLSVISSSE